MNTILSAEACHAIERIRTLRALTQETGLQTQGSNSKFSSS